MGIFDSLFGSKQTTNTNTTGTQSTSNNFNNDPAYQSFLAGFNQQFRGAGNFNVPINPYQTGAANNQQGVASNPALATGFNTAGNIAQNGFAPGMAAFQNPFENQVVGNMQSDFARQNAEQMDAIGGRAAQQGALGNNTGQNALLMRGAQDAQAKAIANTRMTGFNTAADLANRNATTQLAGVGQIGNLTGASTNANQAQFGMGQGMWEDAYKNARTPFDLYNQGMQGYQGAGNLAGSTTNTSGTQKGTTQSNPSFMQGLAGLAGMGMSGFNWGQGNGWWANGGAVKGKGYNDGGSVIPPFHANGAAESFADKVARAHETVSKLRASGGRTESPKGMGPGRFAEQRVTGDPWKATVRHTTDAEQNDQDPFWSPGQAERMVSWPPFRPMQYEMAGLPRFSAGGTPTDNRQYDELFGRAPMEFPGFGNSPATGLNGDSNTTAMGPAFGGNPFAQFPDAATNALGEYGDMPSTGQILPFRPGSSPVTGITDMPPFNPSAPQGGMVPTSGPGPVMDPNATVSSDGGAGRGRSRVASPNEEFAAMLLAASGPQVFGGAGEAALKNHQRRVSEWQAEQSAAQLAQQLAQQNIENRHRADVLAETTRHNQATEANRNQNRPETAFDVSNAQAAAKAAQERESAAGAAQDKIRRLDQMSVLLSNPNMPQGRFADWEVEGRRIAAGLFPGVNIDGLAEAEAFRTMSNSMALDMRSTAEGAGMPGAMSDADRIFLLQTVPRLQNTPAGNRLIVNSMRDTAQYRAAVNQEAARYIRSRRSNEGLSEHMDEWMQRNTMERIVPRHAETRREAERVAQQNAPPPPTQAQTPSFNGYTREQLAAMPEGPVLTPQGAPTGFIRRGNELVPVQGAVGTQGNPHPRLADATQPGQYAYDKGKLYRRTNNMLTNRWEEVTQ